MVLSKEAEEAKPKKPMNTYMKFRNQRLAQLKDNEDRNNIVKTEWKQLSDDAKDKLKKEVDHQNQQYEKDLQKWRKKYNVSEGDEKRKKSKKKKDLDADDDQVKVEKSKGEKKKKEEENSKVDKQKGKDKDKDKKMKQKSKQKENTKDKDKDKGKAKKDK